LLICPAGSSRMLCVFRLMLVTLNGANRCQSFSTCRLLLSATTSIENSMPKVWIPDEGLIRSPHPASSRLLPAKPTRRVRDVSAIVIRVPTVVALVMFLRFIVFVFTCRCVLKANHGRLECFRVLSAVYHECEYSHSQNTCDDSNECCRIHLMSPPFSQSRITLSISRNL